MSPRLMSISSSSVSVTDIGDCATSRSPSQVTMRLTRVVRPDGQTVTASPGPHGARDDLPGVAAELVVGRSTSCTGKRNGFAMTLRSTSTVSRNSSSGCAVEPRRPLAPA